jgi:DNA-binding IclR family transcriptional regulator
MAGYHLKFAVSVTYMVSPGVRLSLAILDRLSAAPGGMGFSRLRRSLEGATASALSRQLHALAELGWVEGGKERPWRCGPTFIGAAERLSKGPDLGNLVTPTVESLAQATGQSAALVTWEGDGFVFRAKSERPDSFHYLAVGEKNKSASGHAFGVVCLAYAPEQDRQAWARADPEADLDAQAALIKARGWHTGIDVGLRICSPVLRSDGSFAAVLGISLMQRTLGEREVARLASTVRRYAREAGIRIS